MEADMIGRKKSLRDIKTEAQQIAEIKTQFAALKVKLDKLEKKHAT